MSREKDWVKVTKAPVRPDGHLLGLHSVPTYLEVEGYYDYFHDRWLSHNGVELHPTRWRPR